ncbi:MAG: sigma-70 family RNA polymerase sigma factor [Pseudomonadota bacterium]|nr:sigma-70 family RNA polymerase sigma factor [Pseudomonadota bacterium]
MQTARLPIRTPPLAPPPVRARPDLPVSVSWEEMLAHRDYLVGFARRRLRDPLLAEDAVHDVFEAVLSGRAVFAGRSALRSWLVAVLKHKIVDSVRRSAGTDSLDAGWSDEEEMSSSAFEPACPRPRPDQLAEQHQLLVRTLARIDALPPGLRDAIRLRVLEELPTEAVCRQLGISEDNLFVRIHRARQRLLS